jgi:hypothetical protein
VLGIIVPAVLLASGINAKWFLLAPVTWMIAIGIKALPSLLPMFTDHVPQIRNTVWASVWEGLLSAISELGLTVLFFAYYHFEISVSKVFAFGLGIGFAEVLFIVYLILEDLHKLDEEVTNKKGFVLWPQLIERIIAIGLHVFSRAVIGITMIEKQGWALACIAFIAFAFVDGYGGYAERTMNLAKPIVQVKIYGVILSVTLLLAIICFTGFSIFP